MMPVMSYAWGKCAGWVAILAFLAVSACSGGSASLTDGDPGTDRAADGGGDGLVDAHDAGDEPDDGGVDGLSEGELELVVPPGSRRCRYAPDHDAPEVLASKARVWFSAGSVRFHQDQVEFSPGWEMVEKVELAPDGREALSLGPGVFWRTVIDDPVYAREIYRFDYEQRFEDGGEMFQVVVRADFYDELPGGFQRAHRLDRNRGHTPGDGRRGRRGDRLQHRRAARAGALQLGDRPGRQRIVTSDTGYH